MATLRNLAITLFRHTGHANITTKPTATTPATATDAKAVSDPMNDFAGSLPTALTGSLPDGTESGLPALTSRVKIIFPGKQALERKASVLPLPPSFSGIDDTRT